MSAASPVTTSPAESPRALAAVHPRLDLPVSLAERIGDWEVVLAARPRPTTPGRLSEDGALVVPLPKGALVFAVADGCGGMPSGGDASTLALDAFARALRTKGGGDDPVALALTGFDDANAAVRERFPGAGTTLAAAILADGVARVLHVGDSLALVVGQRGRMRYLATPHSPTGYAVAAGMLDADDALDHADRSIVSNIVGMEDMRVDVGPPIRLNARDTVLLASDGLSDNLFAREIVDHVRSGPVRASVDALLALATERMLGSTPDVLPEHPDDCTILACRRAR